MAKIVDLSVSLEENPSEPLPVKVSHQDHGQSVEIMKLVFGCTASDLPRGLGWADDSVKLGAHAGTHVDAPWHYSPVCAGGRSRTIDEMPLDWFYGDGVVLDMRHKPRGSAVTAEDLQSALTRIGYALKARDIVLVQTGADRYWGQAEYFDAGCGMTRASTLWLIEQGIRVMGTDAWGWDRPFWAIREDFSRTGDPTHLWGAHFAGIDHEYCHIEKLANLDRLPRPLGFKVACFPVRLAGGSAGWSRVVAIFEDQAGNST